MLGKYNRNIKSLRLYFYASHQQVLNFLSQMLGYLGIEAWTSMPFTSSERRVKLLIGSWGFGGERVSFAVRFWGAVSRPPSLREIYRGFPDWCETRIFVSSHALPPKRFKRLFGERILFVKVNDGRVDLAFRRKAWPGFFTRVRERAWRRNRVLKLYPPVFTADKSRFMRALEPVVLAIKDWLGRRVWFKIYHGCRRLVWLRTRCRPRFVPAIKLFREVGSDRGPPDSRKIQGLFRE